ncbi:MAG: magnesium transporter CorA family protein [Patescibacteria group bacterium]|jgi:magnesium transporter|nr:magnesium transporter CorA family protein [Patescibacteria group bacterium]
MNQNISTNIKESIIKPTGSKKTLSWINISLARKNEIEFLRKKFNFKLSQLRLSSSNYKSQRPMLEESDNYFFLILHFPIFQNENIVSAEIDFFITKDFVITLHNNDLDDLQEFFNLSRKDPESLLSFNIQKPEILLYEILSKLTISLYDILDENSIAISEIESTIIEGEHRKVASKILLLRRNIINIRKIMQNHKNIFKKLMIIQKAPATTAILKEHYSKLIEHSKTFWEILDNQKEMIEALDQTNESMLNYRISDIMKTLTMFSVIVFPLSLLAGLFGMNTMGGMPFLKNPNGFWIIMSIMLFGIFLMILLFQRKKWFK